MRQADALPDPARRAARFPSSSPAARRSDDCTGSIEPLGKAGLVAGPSQFQIEDLALIFLSFPVPPLRLDRQRFYRAQQLARNRRIGPQATKGYVPW